MHGTFRATDAMDDLPFTGISGRISSHLSRAWFANPSAERAGRSDRRQGGHGAAHNPDMRPCAIGKAPLRGREDAPCTGPRANIFSLLKYSRYLLAAAGASPITKICGDVS